MIGIVILSEVFSRENNEEKNQKEKKSGSPIIKLFEEKVKSTMTDSDFDLLEKKLL